MRDETGIMKRFEILDHTADIGIIVHGENLKALLRMRGSLFHLITDLRKVKRRVERRVNIEGESLDVDGDWLSELLYLHDVENLLFKGFQVDSVGEDGLKAREGESFKRGPRDQDRSESRDLPSDRGTTGKRGWRAQVILDL